MKHWFGDLPDTDLHLGQWNVIHTREVQPNGNQLVSVKAIVMDENQSIQSTTARWHPKMSCWENVWGNSRYGRRIKQKKCHGKTTPHMGCTDDWHSRHWESYQLLESARLKDSTLIAAEKQPLNTRSIKAGDPVYHTKQNPRWRLFREVTESVQLELAGYKMQAGTV